MIRRILSQSFSTAVALSLAAGLLTGCSNQGEGQLCDRLNGNDDCESGLACVPVTYGAAVGAICCPISDPTTEACKANERAGGSGETTDAATSSEPDAASGSSSVASDAAVPDASTLDAATQDAAPSASATVSGPDSSTGADASSSVPDASSATEDASTLDAASDATLVDASDAG